LLTLASGLFDFRGKGDFKEQGVLLGKLTDILVIIPLPIEGSYNTCSILFRGFKGVFKELLVILGSLRGKTGRMGRYLGHFFDPYLPKFIFKEGSCPAKNDIIAGKAYEI